MRLFPTRGVRLAVASFACLFGVLTVFGGGTALFGSAEAKAAAGDVVGFVLWFNFLAGFAYVAVGAGLFANRPWAAHLALAIAAASAVVLAGLGLHILTGHPYEMRTLIAMTVRTALWIAIALYLRKARPTEQA